MAKIPLDRYFIKIARIVAERSSCTRRSVGAVFSLDGRVVSTGYNNAPSGVKHCDEVGCTMQDGHCIRASHAELNGILNASQAGQSLKGSTVYTTTYPCLRCLISLRNAKVQRIVFCEPYPYSESEDLIFKELEPLFQWTKYEVDGPGAVS